MQIAHPNCLMRNRRPRDHPPFDGGYQGGGSRWESYNRIAHRPPSVKIEQHFAPVMAVASARKLGTCRHTRTGMLRLGGVVLISPTKASAVSVIFTMGVPSSCPTSYAMMLRNGYQRRSHHPARARGQASSSLAITATTGVMVEQGRAGLRG